MSKEQLPRHKLVLTADDRSWWRSVVASVTSVGLCRCVFWVTIVDTRRPVIVSTEAGSNAYSLCNEVTCIFNSSIK